MRTEDQTPVKERYLWLDGFVSPSSLKLVESGLGKNLPLHGIICFVGFAYADLALPKQFDLVFDLDCPTHFQEAALRVIRVTQQFGKPFDEIPHGWKTVCLIEFPLGIPALFKNMPIVDSWYKSPTRIGLCNKHVWPEVLAGLNSTTSSPQVGRPLK